MSDEKEKKEDKQPEAKDNIKVTQHQITVNGQTLAYTATTGTIVLKEEDDKEGHKSKAEVFFVAYTRDEVGDLGQRPLTFSFNGGPGSSSVWLHLGILGPRRVPVTEDDSPPRPPYQLVDNEYTLLEETDLVFIDPVGTGYSRMIAGEKSNPHEFHTFQRDIESVGEFIRLYTSRYKRWHSPKFLIGESYGTTRAAGLSDYLQSRHGFFLNGIMLVSSILNFQTARFQPGNDLPHIVFLPTYAATAWYHKKIEEKYLLMPLEAFLDEVEDFAESEYTLALMKGSRLEEHERAHIIERLAAYTGLSWQYIEQTNLRINIHRFVKEFMRDEGLTVGRFDSRLKGRDSLDVGEGHEYDPSYAVVQGVYSACLNAYIRAELGYESDLPYEIISFKVHPKWRYDNFENTYVNTADSLRAAMSQNPYLRVLVANGYYDLATPYFATEYTFDHLGLRGDLDKNIQMTYYEAGHMMYIHQPSLAKLKADLSAFITG
ncbi:MAG: peptidase S10 [Chloroflexi bacterium]|nr:peptidase S10 [Chloroflexota bacterium]